MYINREVSIKVYCITQTKLKTNRQLNLPINNQVTINAKKRFDNFFFN